MIQRHREQCNFLKKINTLSGHSLFMHAKEKNKDRQKVSLSHIKHTMIIYKTNAILIAHGNKKENLQNVQPDIFIR